MRVPSQSLSRDEAASRDLEPIGVVDIGSNSVRLVVYDGAVRSPTPIFNEKVLAGLGRNIVSTGRLDQEAVERTLAELKRFRAILRLLQVKNVHAIATAACREASNGPDFIRRAGQILDVPIEIVSGLEEAELAANGILMGFDDPDGVIGDLGGGSLELIDIGGRSIREQVSLPLGGLRLIDTSGARIEKAAEIVDEALGGVKWLGQGTGRTFYAVGGTWRSFAKMHMEARDYPLKVMQAYTLKAGEAIEFAERIRKSRKVQNVEGGAAVAKARRETLPYGALVLERLIKRMKPENIVFSVYGIREGLVYRLLSKAEQRKDPLIAFCLDYARMRSRSPEHGLELCTWTDQLFGPDGLKETAEERRLRHAACLLSDIGWRAHPDYRGEQSLNVVAHSGMTGIDHLGRVFLSLAIYFRHAGTRNEDGEALSMPERLRRIVPVRVYDRARIVGAAVRAAHMLSIGRPGVIDEVGLTLDKTRLLVRIPAAHAALDGERLRRRFDALAKLLERPVEIVIAR